MADSKISALTALAETPASGDLLVLVDVSDTTMASGTNKKITFTNLTSTFLTSSTGLLATGATTGATSQAQVFNLGMVGIAADVSTNALTLRSARTSILSTNIIGGIDFQSNDTQLSAPGTVVAKIQALAAATHTASVLTTDLVFTATTTLTSAEGLRVTSVGIKTPRIAMGSVNPSTARVLNITDTSSSDASFFGFYTDLTVSGAITGSRLFYGMQFFARNTRTAADVGANANQVWGFNVNGINEAGAFTATLYGGNSAAQNAGNGSVTTAYGALNQTQNQGSGTITTAFALSAETENTAGGTITTAYGVRGHINNTNGSIPTAYGVYSWVRTNGASATTSDSAAFYARQDRDNGTSTNAYLYYGVFEGTHTLKRGLWLSGETENSVSGVLAVGQSVSAGAYVDVAASTTSLASLRLRSGSAPSSPNAGDVWNDGALTFYMTDATTNAVVNRLNLRGASSGTPAAGFGVGVRVGLMSSTTANQDAGRLTWAWETATHASRAARGKLTAYYTSSEREAITWVADSAGAVVSLQNKLIVTGVTNDSAVVLNLRGYTTGADGARTVISRYTSSDDANWANARHDAYDHYWYGNAAEKMRLTSAGLLGIGAASPAGLLHGHDGSGGFLFVNRTGVSSTLVTVIPDGTGDVTERLHMMGWVSNSAGGFVSQVDATYLDVSSSTTKTDGSNTLTIAVTAAGAFTLQTTLGSATWKVLLWVFWR